jgi:hypothetical protein
MFNSSRVQFMEYQVVMALLEDKQSLGRESCHVPIFCFHYYAGRFTSGGLSQLDQRGETTSSMRLGGLEGFHGDQLSLFTIIHHRDHFHTTSSWFRCILMIPVKQGYYWAYFN